MKKILVSIALMFMAGSVFAESDVYKFQTISATTTVSTIPVKLHSIVFSSTQTAAQFVVYDSTYTAGTSTVIKTFPVPSLGGTYIFDSQTQKGIQINMPAGSPEITVTYR